MKFEQLLEQGGVLRHYREVNIFFLTLKIVAIKYLAKYNWLFAVFMKQEKAYDRVDRKSL